ncbi:MAG: hypothetical protein OHK0039_29340 [Bacteroidia bacterium]
MPDHSFFYLGLSFILLHEMDAVRCREWRIFPGLSLLGERPGFIVFILAHIPLFFWLLYALLSPGDKTALIHGLDTFFVVHLGLHLVFLWHKNNAFTDWLSWTFIVGAALGGAGQTS